MRCDEKIKNQQTQTYPVDTVSHAVVLLLHACLLLVLPDVPLSIDLLRSSLRGRHVHRQQPEAQGWRGEAAPGYRGHERAGCRGGEEGDREVRHFSGVFFPLWLFRPLELLELVGLLLAADLIFGPGNVSSTTLALLL